jgi:hypothetical protein
MMWFLSDEASDPSRISTGHLPPVAQVRTCVTEAYGRYKSIDWGKVAVYIPALVKMCNLLKSRKRSEADVIVIASLPNPEVSRSLN